MAGYSSTPLLKKLGIKPGDVVYLLNPPLDYFTMIAPLPRDVLVKEIDQRTLVVRLEALDLGPRRLRHGRELGLDLLERRAPVDLGLPHAQQVQVRPVQD